MHCVELTGVGRVNWSVPIVSVFGSYFSIASVSGFPFTPP